MQPDTSFSSVPPRDGPFLSDRLRAVALFSNQRSEAMKQAELNRQVAQQLGESICEIARRGFSLIEEVSDEPASRTA